MNEIEDKGPTSTDNSGINAPRYFELSECGKNVLKIMMPCMNERAWQLRRNLRYSSTQVCTYVHVREENEVLYGTDKYHNQVQ